MPVGVVVDLEAVQVEQHERGLGLVDRGQVGEQLAAVAEPGQGVRRGLDAAGADHAQVLLEDQRHPPDHRHDTGCRQHEREQVHLPEVA